MKNIIYLILAILIFSNCEKVIDLDLNDASPQIVVEAELIEGVHDFTVSLSYTRSYYKNDEQKEINNASVSLTNSVGNVTDLSYLGNGIYGVNDYEAMEGEEYTLTVELDGQSYESTVEVPSKARLDSLSYEYFDGMFGQEGGYVVFMHFQDNPSEENYYRAFYDLNGEPQRKTSDVYILDDKFTNGSTIDIPLIVDIFEVGDTIDLSFYSIDPQTYDYILTLNTIIGNGQPSAAPANPNSNFSNGALGYLAAYNGEEMRIVIGE